MQRLNQRGQITLAAALWSGMALGVGAAPAADWSNWRGPFQTGVAPDTNLPAKWSDDPKAPVNFLWKAPFASRSAPIVMDGRVYINNQIGEGVNEQERVMCLDAATGKVHWEKRFNVFHTDIVSTRLGWTTMVGDPATGLVYWHGTQGHLICFDKDGKTVWQRQLTELDGRTSGYGGRLPSPALAGDLLIMGMINSSWGDQSKGKGGNRVLALNKKDGTPVWWSEISLSPATYMSTPVAATIGGQELIITGASDGALHALQAGTGKEVWAYKFCKGAINCSPVVEGTLVYANHGEESPGTNVQGRIICLDAGQVADGKPKLVWEKDGIQAKFTTPVVVANRLYLCDDVARLWCFDAKSGQFQWNYIYGRNSMGSPVWGDGKVYVGAVNSTFHILEPGDKKCQPLDEHFFPSPDGVSEIEVNGTPAISDGRVYFSAGDELFCIGGKDVKPAKLAPQPPSDLKKGKPAQLLIYPCDVTLHPGQDATFKLNVYDEYGNFVETVTKADDVLWSMPQPPAPPGSKVAPKALDAEIQGGTSLPAKLIVSKNVPAQQGYVEAQYKGLKARARVRVAPALPYAEDFEKMPLSGAPAGWINCQSKFVIKKLTDNNMVLAKVTDSDNPLIARGSCFLGTPQMTNYTIEADLLGGTMNNKMPDMGVGACRYTLMLTGQTQTLRLVSWDAMPRVDSYLPFPWKAHAWYRIKLIAEVDGDKGTTTLRGKVWPWPQPEPDKWTVEYVDPKPNLEGAPFLYGYVLGHGNNTAGAEVFFDNVAVTPNKK